MTSCQKKGLAPPTVENGASTHTDSSHSFQPARTQAGSSADSGNPPGAAGTGGNQNIADEKASGQNHSRTVEEKPDWVRSGGNSQNYPPSHFITGFSMIQWEGTDSLESAKTTAAADLANKVSVRIEHTLQDVNQEKNGETAYHVASVTRATSDVRLSGLQYEVYKKNERTFVLAILNRVEAASRRLLERDKNMEALNVCLDSARAHQGANRNAQAASIYQSCRKYIVLALEHDAVISVLTASLPAAASSKYPQVQSALVAAAQEIRDQIDAVLRSESETVRDAVESLALQLSRQGVVLSGRSEIAPLTYGTTNFSSPLGRQLSYDLGAALGRLGTEQKIKTDGEQVLKGVFFEENQKIRISVTARDIQTGGIVANGESTLKISGIPSHLPIRPANFKSALAAQRLLSEDETVSGKLNLELWADKGRRGVVYEAADEMHIFIRVNKPAYVRLVYNLESGLQVPIDQGYYIDASKVNRAVEYPDTFEIVAPFGIEHIFATAFTQKPKPLPVVKQIVDGIEYDIIADGLKSLVRHRGISRKSKEEVAESVLTITTLKPAHWQ